MNFVGILLILVSGFLLSSCAKTAQYPLLEGQILSICLDEKKKAITPEAGVNISNSKKGNRIGFSLSFSSNFIKGVDPETVYVQCLERLSKYKT